MKRHGIGVVGCGVWGTHSLQEILLRQEGVEMVAVSSHDRWGECQFGDPVAAGRKYAGEKGCDFCEDWEAVVEDPEVDIVSVMTSPARKLEVVLAALERGKSAVMDKPLAMDVEGARRMVEAEKKSRGVGMVLCGHQYGQPCEKLRELIDEGRLGELRHVDSWLYFTGGVYPGFRPTERYRSEVPGGEMTVIGTHAMQTVLAVAGRRPVEVRCRIGQRFYEEYAAVGYEDWAELLLKLENGVTAGVSVGRLPHKLERQLPLLEVSGTRGYAVVEREELTVWPGEERFSFEESQQERYDRLFGDFLRAVETEGESPIGFEDLYQVQRVLDAGYAAAERGAAVRLEDE